jgi:hypothetical protein
LAVPVRAQAPGKEPKQEPPPYDKTFELKLADLDEFAVKTDKAIINNFSLWESADATPKGMATLKLWASCRNRALGHQQYTIMVVGLDEKKGVLWATKANSWTEGKGVGLLQDYMQSIPQGTLTRTHSLWVRAVIWEQAAPEATPLDK